MRPRMDESELIRVSILVTKRIPDYLKLHLEEADDSSSPGSCEKSLASLCRAFECATGWKLRIGTTFPEDRPLVSPASGSSKIESNDSVSDNPSLPSNEPAASPHAAVPRANAEQLATEVGALLGELREAHETIWKREAELATGIPVRRRSDETSHLALRLEAILKGGAEALCCQSAGLYLLDDATSELKLRSSWGMPRRKLLEPPRPLRGAIADLEALLGHAVVIDDTALLPHWNLPEPCASAACVPVASPTEPLGTLWFFCQTPRDFSSQQTNLLEMIAGRIASELQRDVLLTECTQLHASHPSDVTGAWQRSRAPSIKPQLHGWQIAGGNVPATQPVGCFHDWFVASDGTVALVAATCGAKLPGRVLTTAELRGILYGVATSNRDAAGTVQLVDDAFRSSSGSEMASLTFARLIPDSGELEFASAGTANVLHVRNSGARWLTTNSAPLGDENQNRCQTGRIVLGCGESIVLAAWNEFDNGTTSHVRDKLVSLFQRKCQRSLEQLSESIHDWLAASDQIIDASHVSLRRTD